MTAFTHTAYLLTGSNMGHREGYLAAAKAGIAAECGTLMAQSAIYQTAAWGLQQQAPFLNQVLCIATALSAQPLLKKLLALEEALGRKRTVKFGPRTIDIDILLYNDAVIDTEALQVPHPQLPFRRFVLAPLAEVAPQLLHPVLQKTIAELLLLCPDTLPVEKF